MERVLRAFNCEYILFGGFKIILGNHMHERLLVDSQMSGIIQTKSYNV